MIEKEFEIPFIAGLARREKQIQQNYRPIRADSLKHQMKQILQSLKKRQNVYPV
jgi:hypothetical protein